VGRLFDFDRVRLHGAEPLIEASRQGRGALLVCAHLGNLDLCRALSLRTPGLRVTVLVHTKHAQAFNDMLAQLDPRSQPEPDAGDGDDAAMAMQLSERIGRGEFVVIAGDRVPVSANPRVALAPFLGRTAAFPIGPYVMAAVLGCPLYRDVRDAHRRPLRRPFRTAARQGRAAAPRRARRWRNWPAPTRAASNTTPARAARVVQLLRFLAFTRFGTRRCCSLT
jgi:predicted LPLAT superfamily acyltransferase